MKKSKELPASWRGFRERQIVKTSNLVKPGPAYHPTRQAGNNDSEGMEQSLHSLISPACLMECPSSIL